MDFISFFLCSLAFISGLVIAKKTSKEVEQYRSIISLFSLLTVIFLTGLFFIMNTESVLSVFLFYLSGFVFSFFLSRVRGSYIKQSLFFLTLGIAFSWFISPNLYSVFLFIAIIYFMIKGSLSKEFAKEIIVISSAFVSFLIISSLSSFTVLSITNIIGFCLGCVLGAESALYAVAGYGKNIKERTKNRKNRR